MDTKVIGGKIAKARKRSNMSQAELARLLFISPQAVGKWERGESVPDISTVNRLAEILGVDLNYFSANGSPTGEGVTLNPAVEDGSEVQAIQEADAPQDQLLTDFSGSDLSKTDFAGVVAPKTKFNGSALNGADFSGADLTGSSFKASNLRDANFDKANLTDCILHANDMARASFDSTVLVRTEFSASGLEGATFANLTMAEVKLTKTDLRKTLFENCVFNGADFKYSDLRGLCLDGQTFTGVKFHNAALDEASFRHATLKNVSFRSTFALTNRYYKALKTICFDGASMDKLTYAALKGLGADLSKVSTL